MLAITTITAAWIVREDHFGRLKAHAQFQDFVQHAYEARLPLSIPGVDSDIQREDAARVLTLLGQYGVMENERWQNSPSYVDVDAAERQRLDEEVVRMLHALGAASLKQASREPTRGQRQATLDAAQSYNAAAARLASASLSQLSAAIDGQRNLIERSRSGQTPPSAIELMENATSMAGSQVVQLIERGRYGDALPDLLKLRDQTPKSLSAWMLLGVARAGIGNAAEAEECFTTCTRLRPQFPFSYFQRGLARLEQKKYAAAADDFSRYIEMCGVSPAALVNRALAREKSGAPQLALADLNAALAAGATQTRIYFIRARVRKELKDSAGAQADFQQGLALTPSDGASWLARGMAQLAKSPQLALADFQQARRLDPGNRAAAQNILHVLVDRLQREDEALKLLDALLAANPRDARALLTRAVVKARAGEAENAAADATAALAIDDNPTASLQAACAFAQASRTESQYRGKAFDLLARSLGAQPGLAIVAGTDPDLEPLRDGEAFEQILNAADVIRNSGKSAGAEATASR
jgi:tetratricopeptide (TPR) repeat protein